MEDLASIKESLLALANCWVYDLTDGKAPYLLLGHTHWASGTKPFLMCDCDNGQSLIGADHQCTMFTDAAYKQLVQNSYERWLKRDKITQERQEWGDGSSYNIKVHKDWCTNENKGVIHLGSVPHDYKVSHLRFDIFHGRSAVVKVMLKYLRIF